MTLPSRHDAATPAGPVRVGPFAGATTVVSLRPVTAERPPDLSVEAPGVSEESSVPWPLLLGQRVTSKAEDKGWYPWVVLATTLFGLLTVTFTITILAVSIPGIAEDLDTSESTLTWVITGPLLAFAVVGPALGKLGDRNGYRRIFLIGMAGSAFFAGPVGRGLERPGADPLPGPGCRSRGRNRAGGAWP